MRKTKVAVIIGVTFAGGVGVAMMNYFRRLDKERFGVDFFVTAEPGEVLRKEIEERGGSVILTPSRRNMIGYFLFLLRTFRRGEYDVVHSNLTTLNPIVLAAAYLAGVKRRIAHCHSSSNPADKLAHLMKNALRPFSRFFATDLYTCGIEAGKWLFGEKAVLSGKVKLVRNAIVLNKFKFDSSKREEIRRELKLEGSFVVGHVGRLCAQKNHAFLVRCFGEVVKHRPDARLLIVGDGELYWDIKVEIALLGIADKVVFTGCKDNAGDYYSAMDVVMFPSLFEGLSVVLVEAQANGLPCLVSTMNSAESKLTDCITFVSLSEPPEFWAKECLKLRRNASVDYPKEIAAAGYDIKTAVHDLEKEYL